MLRTDPWRDHRAMSTSIRGRHPIGVAILSLYIAGLACSRQPRQTTGKASVGIDSLNARVIQAYRNRDAGAYAALYTDTAVFGWPAFNTVRGPAQLAAMVRSNWAALSNMDLPLTVSARRLAPDHATEFGAFQQSCRDPSRVRLTEFGRYVT